MSLTSTIARLRPREHASERSLAPLAWLAGALFAIAAVWLLQIDGRSPYLAWDEAGRVAASEDLKRAIVSADPAAMWRWLHAQAFYPPLMPALHGVLRAAGASPLTAAWLPSLLAYGAAGLLTANLARRLGLPVAACAITAVVYWTAPLSMRLAAWGSTEHVAACVFLLLATLMVRFEQRPRVSTAIAAGVTAGLAALLKYDYAVIVIAALCLGIAIAWVQHGRRIALVYAVALVTLLVFFAGWMCFETDMKYQALQEFVGQGNSSDTRSRQPFYYLEALLLRPSLTGLAPLTGLAFVAGAVYVSYLAVRRRLVAFPVVLLAVALAVYTASALKDARFLCPLLPFFAVFATRLLQDAYLRFEPRLQPARKATVLTVAALLVLTQLGLQLAGPDGAMQRFYYLDASTDAREAIRFTAAQLGDERGDVLLVGSTNWFSARALQYAWHPDGRPSPEVRGLSPQGISRRDSTAGLDKALVQGRVGVIVTLELDPASRAYAYEAQHEAQRPVVQHVAYLAQRGDLAPIGSRSLEDGRIRVDLWRVVSPGSLALDELVP